MSRMGLLERIVLACDIWTSSAIFGPLDSTNYRIYSALYVISQSLDDVPFLNHIINHFS